MALGRHFGRLSFRAWLGQTSLIRVGGECREGKGSDAGRSRHENFRTKIFKNLS